ncbi:hypothetical protein FE257_003978 [Aspergillus nanangensis]|uniref:Uncharacterized protein n=1 Tax=Aspergillus nanangensis TaxID=2582783 RepID=A0AAD4CRQ0_ASPNN|nr:hypothetical protein FE257_003978 [Aspergillus nanangensis]
MTIQPLTLHRDHLTLEDIDLHDPYITTNLEIFAFHNILLRNLTSCHTHSATLATSNFEPFLIYTRFTIRVLTAYLHSTDTIWFPAYAQYDPRFHDLIDAHKPLRAAATELADLLAAAEPVTLGSLLGEVEGRLGKLRAAVGPQFEEARFMPEF